MHEVSSSLGLSVRHIECRGKCFSLIGAFRSKSISRYWRKGERERTEDEVGERGETVGILITLGSRLRALPQQPRRFSLAVIPQQKRNPRLPRRILRARIPSALPWNSTTLNSVDSFPNERTTCAHCDQYFPKVFRQTKSLTGKRELRYSKKN